MKEDAIFLPFFVNSWISFTSGHKSEYNCLGHCHLYQNRMKNSYLKSHFRNKVHNIFKCDIFVNFGAHFFLFQTHMTAFPYESTTCRKISPPLIHQLFVLFHLVGVPCLPEPALMNLWTDFCWKPPKYIKNTVEMPLFQHAIHLIPLI